MGGFSLWHWLVVIILVMLLFGRGKISEMMGDVGKGLKSFKEGMAEDDASHRPPETRQLPRTERDPIDVRPERRRDAEPSVPPAGSPDDSPRP